MMPGEGRQEQERVEAARQRSAAERAVIAERASMPRLLGAPLAQWFADKEVLGWTANKEFVLKDSRAHLDAVTGRELAEALALSKFRIRP